MPLEKIVDGTTRTPTVATAAPRRADAAPANLDAFLAGVERRAYRMAALALGPDDALDAVQEAMYQLVKHYRTRPSQEWAPLFYRILQGKIADHHRRARVRRVLQPWFGGADELPLGETLPDPRSPDPERVEQQRRALAVVDNALQALPRRQQQVFLLRVFEGLDVAQTAVAMGCTEGSVKTHYARALKRLRPLLGDHWP
ncbi:MAG: RNA polymerase sigma factor [Candidatus Competibacterales bacterium]